METVFDSRAGTEIGPPIVDTCLAVAGGYKTLPFDWVGDYSVVAGSIPNSFAGIQHTADSGPCAVRIDQHQERAAFGVQQILFGPDRARFNFPAGHDLPSALPPTAVW